LCRSSMTTPRSLHCPCPPSTSTSPQACWSTSHPWTCELYRWLALLAAQSGPMKHWGRDNQRWTLAVLKRYPALRPRYRRLVAAHLALRPAPATPNPATPRAPAVRPHPRLSRAARVPLATAT
ncbi:hypothetical protein B1218_35965, partial [Pseudomonas ogarae]